MRLLVVWLFSVIAAFSQTTVVNGWGSGGASVPGAGIVKSTGSALATAVPSTDYTIPSLSTANLVANYSLLEGQGSYAYNSASPPQPNYNLIGPSEQGFATWTAKNGVTLTENYAADPNGNFLATRLQLASGGYLGFGPSYPYVNGQQYTLSLYVASNTGLAQSVRMANPAVTWGSDITIPATGWTRISKTFTATGSGYVLPIGTDLAGDAIDVQIWGAQLEIGPHPTPYVSPVFTMQLGGGAQNTTKQPTWNGSGYLDFTANSGASYAQALSWQPINLSKFTVYAVAKWSASEFLSSYAPILYDVYASSGLQLFADSAASGKAPGIMFHGSLLYSFGVNANDGNWHIYSATYDGTTLSVYFDDLLINTATVALTPVQVSQLFLSNINNSGYWPGQIAQVALYSVAHSAATVLSNVATLQKSMAARGITVSNVAKLAVWEGDSITDPSINPINNLKYPYLGQTALSPIPQGRNFAVTGSTLTTMNTRAAAVDALISGSTATKKVLSILIGRNDLLAQNAGFVTTWVASLKAYCLARKAANPSLKIALATILPSTASNFNTERNLANAAILADSSYYDVIVPFAADATMGCDACSANATYYSDGTHPTAAGQAILGPIWAAAVANLF